MPCLQFPSLFSAFDVFPSGKGASVHIAHNAQTLFQWAKGGVLYVLGNKMQPTFEQEQYNAIIRFPSTQPNYLQRAKAFSNGLFQFLQTQTQLQICHFRDIWSGLPILTHNLAQERSQKYQTIYEVNGIASIELPYHYPLISQNTLQKIQQLEQFCYQNADFLLTPSETIKQNLIKIGVSDSKITVISNGADIPNRRIPRPLEAPERYIIYFGTLQLWQGIDTLLQAFRYLLSYFYNDIFLVICASTRAKTTKKWYQFAQKLGVAEKVIWKYQLSQNVLQRWIKHALFSVAPLKACSRNISQGCCPIKILESMAVATPVIASDLPTVRDIITSEKYGKLVPPDRPIELARAMCLWVEQPQVRKNIGIWAQDYIRNNYTWAKKHVELRDFYQTIKNQSKK
ncbi:MAG: glycosyltransferase family 4 protein [Microscillaceae bacterium]|nr:glycosyltransferase family 4 protein [Microscillaceae bacterium]MDW8461058.1 glycosyltransferase family 4 protein [Cytophagales bacterium]